ncbi:MAG: acyl-CoA thioesterase [Paludibacteraceae bacterium]|nr:acyl-CoA thioesterase [Paludibacteraceae bacterium]MBR2266328.1 acyl-CoA thioesterase [Paludibacteraceae bacterium]
MKAYRHEVKYYECDRMGITHHSNYVRFMEEARIDLMDQLGYGYERMEAEGIVSPVLAIELEYKHPTTFKDKIDITLSLSELSALKMSFSYVMKVGDTVVCTAKSRHCFLEHGKPVKIEERFPDFVKGLR